MTEVVQLTAPTPGKLAKFIVEQHVRCMTPGWNAILSSPGAGRETKKLPYVEQNVNVMT